MIPSRNQSIPSTQADPAKSSLTFEKYQPSKFLVERAVNYEVTRATHQDRMKKNLESKFKSDLKKF